MILKKYDQLSLFNYKTQTIKRPARSEVGYSLLLVIWNQCSSKDPLLFVLKLISSRLVYAHPVPLSVHHCTFWNKCSCSILSFWCCSSVKGSTWDFLSPGVGLLHFHYSSVWVSYIYLTFFFQMSTYLLYLSFSEIVRLVDRKKSTKENSLVTFCCWKSYEIIQYFTYSLNICFLGLKRDSAANHFNFVLTNTSTSSLWIVPSNMKHTTWV